MKFFSCVKDKLVSRMGSATFIGARRDPTNPKTVHFFPDRVVAIPDSEFARYRKTYLRAIRSNELVERTEAEWDAQQAAEAAAQKAAQEAAAPARGESTSEPDSGAQEAAQGPEHDTPEDNSDNPLSEGPETGGSRKTKGRRSRRS